MGDFPASHVWFFGGYISYIIHPWNIRSSISANLIFGGQILGLGGWDIISYLARDIISPSPFHIKGPSLWSSIYVYVNPPLNHGILGVFAIRGMGLVISVTIRFIISWICCNLWTHDLTKVRNNVLAFWLINHEMHQLIAIVWETQLHKE